MSDLTEKRLAPHLQAPKAASMSVATIRFAIMPRTAVHSENDIEFVKL